ncbi:MAG TPA: hypothetical protein PKE29_16450 [Phycisphaerales bacterium]|nr:hypothetical protein [Phycisphaerales bacterium]
MKVALTLLLIASPAFFACERKPPIVMKVATQNPDGPALSAPPEITSESEKDWFDLVFFVSEATSGPDGTRVIRAKGLYKGQSVGFEVVLPAEWRESNKGGIVLRPGKAAYRSVGAESDTFLTALDTIYSTNLHPKAMAHEVKLTAIGLSGDPSSLDKGPARIKMFYESNDPSAGAEFYTNIDLARHRLEVREKDDGYRRSLVQAFTAK